MDAVVVLLIFFAIIMLMVAVPKYKAKKKEREEIERYRRDKRLKILHGDNCNERSRATMHVTVRTSGVRSHSIPDNAVFHVLGDGEYHKSRDCLNFSNRDYRLDWEALTEEQAKDNGLILCPMCSKPFGIVYPPHGKVLHKNMWCSNAASEPKQITIAEAEERGYRKCSKCWSNP